MRGAWVICYINYWRSMFLAERDGVITFFLTQFLLRRLKVYAKQYLLPQGVAVHLHSRWVMHFKSLKRAAIFTRYCWDLLGRESIRRHDWSETLRVYIEYSSHEYVYASFAPYRFSKIRHLRFEKILIIIFSLIGQ